MTTRIFKLSNLQIFNQEEEDMISKLPDEILISIISLIPTKEALTTRVLSKRWRNLFHLIPALAFVRKCNFRCTCNSEDFINGVDQILQRHSASIHSFDLRCCLPESCISTQLSVVFTRLGNLGVQKLKFRPSYLSFYKPGYMKFPFPCHLLSLMKSLLHFKLSSCSLSNYPPRNNSLKTLRLSKVCCASPNSLESVLSNCVNLCSLTLKKCKLPSKLCFPRLVDLQLKCLVIHKCEGLEEIDVYAANLLTFGFNTNYMVNLIFIHVPKLQSVYLTSRQLHMSQYCGQLAKYSHSLKTLVLNDVGNLYQDGCIDVGKNMFGKLKRLELIVLTLNRLNLLSLALVLRGLPCLEEFHLSTMAPVHVWTKEEKHVIVESRSQLKVVEINGFGGDKSQIMFVEYILKSSTRLEKMIISMYSSQYMGFGEWLVYGFPPRGCYGFPPRGCYGFPPRGCYGFPQVYECIERMKHKAVSKTLRVVAKKFPETKSKCF